MWFLLPSCSSAMAIRKNTTRLAQILMLSYGSNHQFQCVLGRGGGVSHTTSRFVGPIWMSHHSTQFWHYLPRESIRVSRWRLPPPSSDASNKSRLWPRFWRTGYTGLSVLRDPFLGSTNFLKQLTQFRETFYLLDHWFITRDFHWGVARWRAAEGEVQEDEEGDRQRVRGFDAISRSHSPRISTCSQLRSSPNPTPLAFGEGSGSPLQRSCLENAMDGGIW